MLNIIKYTCLLLALSVTPFIVADEVASGEKVAVSADKAAEKAADPTPKDIGLNLSSGLDVIGGLFLVLALFMACAWLMKRTQGGFLAASKEMKTLGAMSLGTREKAVLVEVEGKKLLLAVSPGRVNTLHVFENEDNSCEVNADKESTEPVQTQSKHDFASQLMKMIPNNSQNDTASK